VSAALLSGWGRTAATRPAQFARASSTRDVRRLLAAAPERGAIARGFGRSYGDAAQRAGGLVVGMLGLDHVETVDTAARTATVGAGVSMQTLVRRTLPFGLFPAVTPGTEMVSIGGAIACDVHGKNHHADGAFSAHVESFELVTTSGDVLHVEPESTADVFQATAGGLGLTGVVVRATVRLIAVDTAWMSVDTERAADLDDAFSRFASDDDYRYSVAWIDCLARGRHLGRSVLMRGNHAGLGALSPVQRGRPLELAKRPSVPAPAWVPSGLVNRTTISVFNELYFRRASLAGGRRLVSIPAFFYPLDAVRHWNRLYGARGFVQYQFVVPYGAEDTIRRAIELLAAAGCPSFLAVLKRMGEEHGLLSFPLPGWTLALDVPAAVDGLGPLLDGLDELVAAAGGRVYLAKDARLRPELVETMYPRLSEWREIQARLDPEGIMQSDLSRRLGLVA
jgi:decaprenylphospho-beta-D-ribofuranose 2-oxidase